MTHPIEQAADAAEHELADLRAKLAVAVGELETITNIPNSDAAQGIMKVYARAALAQIKGEKADG